MKNYTPKEIVEELDKYIVGQKEAKKSVAVALRNRYRRNLLSDDFKEEVTPKNIIMVGPTGVGKTEIARRIAKLVEAPFVKVEATKFTEVGYVGRDVDSMVRDLVEAAVRMVKEEKLKNVTEKAKKIAEDRLIDYIVGKKKKQPKNPLEMLFNYPSAEKNEETEEDGMQYKREEIRQKLRNGELDNYVVEIEVTDASTPMLEMYTNLGSEEMNINLQDIFADILPKKKKIKKVPVYEAKEF